MQTTATEIEKELKKNLNLKVPGDVFSMLKGLAAREKTSVTGMVIRLILTEYRKTEREDKKNAERQ